MLSYVFLHCGHISQCSEEQIVRIIRLEKLSEEPYLSIICYPRFSKKELERRLKELRKLGVSALEFCGEKQVFNEDVLGKGCVGIVIKAHVDNEKAAIKIRRVDANRDQMQHEAEMLRRANLVNVGPKFLRVSKNFLLMQFVRGIPILRWIKKKKKKT